MFQYFKNKITTYVKLKICLISIFCSKIPNFLFIKKKEEEESNHGFEKTEQHFFFVKPCCKHLLNLHCLT